MFRLLILILIVAAGAACSNSPLSSTLRGLTPTGPTAVAPPGTVPPSSLGSRTITITATGMSPLEITINVGQRVTFVNNDSRPHDVVGGKDPATPDCPEIVQAGFLAPGQSAETGVFTQAKTCEYHDHTMLSVPAFQGRIIIR